MLCGCAIIQCMSELWDAVDIDHRITGHTICRNDQGIQWLNDHGYYHVIVLGFIITKKHLVLSRRAPGKLAAGYYEVSGGNVLHGETSVEAIKREWKEEIGYDPKDHMVQPLQSSVYDVNIYDPFVVFDDTFDPTKACLKEDEVEQILLVDKDQFNQLIQSKQVVDCLFVYQDQINQWLSHK